VAVGILVGALGGGMLARLLTGVGGSSDGVHEAQSLLLGLVFGGIAAVFFWLRERNANLLRELQLRELARLEAEKQSLAAQLRLLQAQIEPHFLFNSLANVAALIDADPARAGRLLDALIRYLRSSLQRTRAEGGSLGDEVGLLRAYLDILKIRMGERLDYAFEIPPELLGRDFPPMLLQPLVENAIRHGLEPKLGGGFLRVDATVADGRLRIRVSDDGIGIAEAPGEGVGLSNIRARLAAIYGPTARLEVTSKVGAGVTATLDIPLESAP
jgi:sensor histidine kinase YesM